MIFNRVAGYLWRFQLFRWAVLQWCAADWIGASWLFVNTPLAYALRQSALSEGRYDDAAELARALREAGWH